MAATTHQLFQDRNPPRHRSSPRSSIRRVIRPAVRSRMRRALSHPIAAARRSTGIASREWVPPAQWAPARDSPSPASVHMSAAANRCVRREAAGEGTRIVPIRGCGCIRQRIAQPSRRLLKRLRLSRPPSIVIFPCPLRPIDCMGATYGEIAVIKPSQCTGARVRPFDPGPAPGGMGVTPCGTDASGDFLHDLTVRRHRPRTDRTGGFAAIVPVALCCHSRSAVSAARSVYVHSNV